MTVTYQILSRQPQSKEDALLLEVDNIMSRNLRGVPAPETLFALQSLAVKADLGIPASDLRIPDTRRLAAIIRKELEYRLDYGGEAA